MKQDRRIRLWEVLALGLASLLALVSAPAQYLGRQQDDLLYVIASHALSQGRYRLFTSPGLPPLTFVIPGLPLLLLPVTFLAGENFAAYQIISTLLMALSPWLFWLWLRRKKEPSAALLCLVFASSPIVLSQAGTVMSEIPYLLLVFLLLAALDAPTGSGWAGGGLLLALTQIRPAGISLLPAAVARALAGGRWRQALRLLLAPLLGLGLWALWSWNRSGSVQELGEFGLSYGGRRWLDILQVSRENAGFYLSSWGSCYFPPAWGQGPAAMAAGLLLFGASLLGLKRILKKDPQEPAAWALVGALLMHAIWAWQYERYLITLLPFLLWALARALGPARAPVLAVMLAAQLGFHSIPRLFKPNLWAEPELSLTYSWIRAHGAESDILASPLYVRDGFYARRPSLPLPDSARIEEFHDLLKRHRARLVLWQEGLALGLARGQAGRIGQMLERARCNLENQRFFKLVYENSGERSRVYELQ
ncbi:MAG: hypothetical protein HY921_04780 [Elusimicrobia bacterium]|nr:hypothetical protein [Elusimicrobiota bacterium]